MPLTASRRARGAAPASEASPFAAFTAVQRGAPEPLGIQSVELGMRMLKCLADAGGPMRLRDLAAAAGMSASKTHRYLVSFCRTGLVAHHGTPPAYGLGPYAVELGARALGAVAPVKLAAAVLEPLAAQIHHTVAIAVWGTRGATIVLLEESAEMVTMNIRPGTTVPLLASASGLLFAAYLPAAQVEPMLAAELAENRRRRVGLRSRAAALAAMDDVRASGAASVDSSLVPGVAALAVPVFDHRARIVLALLAVGRSGGLEFAIDGTVARTLRDHAARISRELGYTG